MSAEYHWQLGLLCEIVFVRLCLLVSLLACRCVQVHLHMLLWAS